MEELADLFLQVVRLASECGLVKLGTVAVDGTKLKANASRHKTMSFGHMLKAEAELKEQIKSLLENASATDAAAVERTYQYREQPVCTVLGLKQAEQSRELAAGTSCPAEQANRPENQSLRARRSGVGDTQPLQSMQQPWHLPMCRQCFLKRY